MPNWTNNVVTVTFANKGERSRWINTVKSSKSEFDFTKIIPYDWDNPDYQDADHLEPVSSEHPNFNWYEFCEDKWGTKWPACHLEVNEDDDTIEYQFNTAWSKPTGIINVLSKKFANLDVTWEWFDEDGGEGVLHFNERLRR